MKKRKTLLFAYLIAISLTGCKKEVERKTEDVKGTVIDVNYQAAYTTVVPHYNAATKTTMLHTQHHPADNDTTKSFLSVGGHR